MMKTLEYDMNLPYRLEIIPDTDEGGYVASQEVASLRAFVIMRKGRIAESILFGALHYGRLFQ